MSVVYFIKPIGMDGPVKIGVSCNVAARRIGLQSWSPFPLEIVATTPGDEQLERRLHARFLHQNSHGEWFRWSEELQATIDAVLAGTFDADTLPSAAGSAGVGLRRARTLEERERHSRAMREVWAKRRGCAASQAAAA